MGRSGNTLRCSLSTSSLRAFGVARVRGPSNQPLQADVVLAYARNHAAERQGRYPDEAWPCSST
jgi:hypothetical protein